MEKTRTALALIALMLLSGVPTAIATSSCPANQAYIGPYTKVEILNKDGNTGGYKLVNEPFTVWVTRVETDKSSKPLTGRNVNIYIVNGTRDTLVKSGTTNSEGKFTYTPTKVGKYKVETSGRAPFFDVWQKLTASDMGAVCGDGECETGKQENQENCPIDCTECGDAECEGFEDKDNCPEDCIICGDGECDESEYSPTGCSCPEDCVECGDNICDTAHGETSETCSEDCGEPSVETKPGISGDLLKEYWWAILIVGAVVAIIVLLKKKPGLLKRQKRESSAEKPKHAKASETKKDALAEDTDVDGIIAELMENGISEKRVIEKLKEFGVDEKEAEKLVKKARR